MRILFAAESLFMESGYAATSLRMIAAKAKVNRAAVNYHFGSKDALIRELFERCLGPLNSAGIANLDELKIGARDRPLTIEQIMEDIIAPAVQVNEDPFGGGAVFPWLPGRVFSGPIVWMRDILSAHYRQLIVRFKEALVGALPDIPDQKLTWPVHFMVGALSYTMTGNEALKPIATCNLEDADVPGTIIGRLIPILVAGLKAPPRKIGSGSGRGTA